MSIDNENLKRIIIISAVVLVIVIIVIVVRKRPQEPQLSTYEVTSEKENQTPEVPLAQESTKTPSYYDTSDAIDFLNEHPWYRKVPIETDMYIISWNLDREEFRLRLKIPQSSSQDVISTYTQSAIAGLKELTGESFDQYNYYIMYQN